MDRLTASGIESATRSARAGIDILTIGDDVGAQQEILNTRVSSEVEARDLLEKVAKWM